MSISNAPTLAELQQQLANAVRLGESHSPEILNPQRLAIYTRLVHNNIIGFINRCFTESPKFCEEQEWSNAQQRFILEGQSHTSFFQEIAGEFLTFCQKHQIFSEDILALMDFEHTQLLAEVAIAEVHQVQAWDAQTQMQISPVAYLKTYPINFISSHLQEIFDESCTVLVWRNHRFDIYYQQLSDIDVGILSYLMEQPCSLQELILSLSDIIAENIAFTEILEHTWQKWIDADVILPK